MPRRGFDVYGTATPCCANIKALIPYKKRILRHHGTKLQYDCCSNLGTFSTFSGCFTEPETGLIIKSVESNSNLYFTTTDGAKKISGTLDACCNTNFVTTAGFIENAGGPKALDVTGVLSFCSTGFLTGLSKTAYRIVWGKTDNNKNLILGSPSGRLVVANTSCCCASVVCLSITIPSDVTTTCFFYQVYRTGITTTCCISCLPCVDPGEEMNLVIENFVTTANLCCCCGIITVQDTVPDSFRQVGVTLYTNPESGDGILQANDKPPVAKDIALFRNSVFYANTSTIQRKQLTLLSVSALTSGVSKFVVGNACKTAVYTFVGAKETTTITTVADVADSLEGKSVNVNSASNERKYAFYFKKDACTVPPSGCDITGRLLVPVCYVACDTAATIACKLQTTMNAQFDFAATVCCNVVTNTNDKNGNAVDIANGTASPGFTYCVTTQGDGEAANTTAGGDVLLSSLVSAGQSIDESGKSLVNIINRDSNGPVNAFYLSGECDLPGIILLEARNLSDSAFCIGVEDACADITGQFNPKLNQSVCIASMAAGPCCVGTRITTSTAHGFVVCNSVYIYCTSNCVLGKKTVTVVACACTFDIACTFTCTSTGKVFKACQTSDNDVSPNRLYFSKQRQPEAVPITNFIDIGGKDAKIERIVALRDSLFALKEDGVFIITGEVAPNFADRLLDCSIIIVSPDTASVLNNQIYALTTQGIAQASDTGIGVVSRKIEDKILEITNDQFCFRTTSFGVSSESDRSYMVWVPTLCTDTTATQTYRYNSFNNTWVRWTKGALHGIVNPRDDKIYIAIGGKVHKERKNNDRTDHADQQFCLCVPQQNVVACSKELIVSSTCGFCLGDVITQCQQVTVAKFNRILRKLDADGGMDCTNYCSTLNISSGACLSCSICALVVKVCADDCTVCYTSPTGGNFTQDKTDFNLLVCELNGSCKPAFSNYKTVTDTTEYEAIVTAICAVNSKVTLDGSLCWLKGPIVRYEGICADVQWAPQHFGDPSIVKQIPEGTIDFDGNNFFSATISYATDLSKNFEDRIFFGRGVGYFGSCCYGCLTWGGCGTEVPIRTLVPKDKQRCRYIFLKFKHVNAREDFKIVGISLEPRRMSTRGYKRI